MSDDAHAGLVNAVEGIEIVEDSGRRIIPHADLAPVVRFSLSVVKEMRVKVVEPGILSVGGHAVHAEFGEDHVLFDDFFDTAVSVGSEGDEHEHRTRIIT